MVQFGLMYGWFNIYLKLSQVTILESLYMYICLGKILTSLLNSAASHQGQHCLPIYALMAFQVNKKIIEPIGNLKLPFYPLFLI